MSLLIQRYHILEHDEAKARIELEIKLPQVINKGKRRIVKLKTSTPLMLTEGKGEDVEEVEDEEESEKEEERQYDHHQAT